MSRRTQVISAFCDAVGGTRGLRYQGEKKLPGRAVFDFTETAVTEYGKIVATLEVSVESIIDSRGANEGETLDSELCAIQKAILNDSDFSDLIDRVVYSGSEYSFSENGSTLVAVAATFSVVYRAAIYDPSQE